MTQTLNKTEKIKGTQNRISIPRDNKKYWDGYVVTPLGVVIVYAQRDASDSKIKWRGYFDIIYAGWRSTVFWERYRNISSNGLCRMATNAQKEFVHQINQQLL